MFFRFTPILKLLIVINVAVYVLDNLLLGSISFSGVPFQHWLMKYFALNPIDGIVVGPNFVLEFYPWQLITYQFMHGGFGHLFFNMFALWMFSSELEETWGSAKFLVFYLLSGIGAGLLHLGISSWMGAVAPTIGASGSLYGVILGFAMLNPNRKIIIFPIFIPISAKFYGIGMMVFSIIMGVMSSDGVAHFAHFGGALTGLLLLKFGEKTPIFKLARKYIKIGLLSNEYVGNSNYFSNSDYNSNASRGYSVNWVEPNRTSTQSSYTNSSTTPKGFSLKNVEVGGVKVSQEAIDSILDKISKSGYASLTEQEKFILTEISKKL